MALDRERKVGLVHAPPVVDHPDQPAPAGFDRDLDRFRASVERVLDKLLDRRRRALDHLARGDAVDGQRIETANWHGISTSRNPDPLAPQRLDSPHLTGDGARPGLAHKVTPISDVKGLPALSRDFFWPPCEALGDERRPSFDVGHGDGSDPGTIRAGEWPWIGPVDSPCRAGAMTLACHWRRGHRRNRRFRFAPRGGQKERKRNAWFRQAKRAVSRGGS